MSSDSQSEYEKDITEIKRMFIKFLEKNPERQPMTDEEEEEFKNLFKKFLERESGSTSPP